MRYLSSSILRLCMLKVTNFIELRRQKEQEDGEGRYSSSEGQTGNFPLNLALGMPSLYSPDEAVALMYYLYAGVDVDSAAECQVPGS